ncbi:hypothetical protein [Kitasatospora indigofera]|uniref:hypothetical protein n=1 Tax=Kitasatospora indigofera TaxID=67307 RepID=UPI0033B755A5
MDTSLRHGTTGRLGAGHDITVRTRVLGRPCLVLLHRLRGTGGGGGVGRRLAGAGVRTGFGVLTRCTGFGHGGG